ncbi:hypothetical protein E2I00_003791 [Balaenoptera physalus]|uniref:Uncharacterized protein n=1 Tax=Balaenoptera physalus TaxID=9770 RepID=A0A6A1QC26_BALPH|nr:hypothetical protein E2I00_003791 [Balaenoptera physalus]
MNVQDMATKFYKTNPLEIEDCENKNLSMSQDFGKKGSLNKTSNMISQELTNLN